MLIRPACFEKGRIPDISELYPVLDKTSVRLRGWDFPHIDQREQVVLEDCLRQETERDIFAEVWQFHQSGQFVHYSSFVEDLLSHRRVPQLQPAWQPGLYFDPVEVIFRLTEIFEFAARLSFTVAADGQTHLEISANGTKNRILKSASGSLNIPGKHPCQLDTLPCTYDLPNAQLVANTKELALEPAKYLFQRFGWNPGVALLRDLQTELLEKSPWMASTR